MLDLTFLGRCGERWRVRVDAPSGVVARGVTVGLVDADSRPLGPAVVAPAEFATYVADLRGPAVLPSDAHVRVTMDGPDGAPFEQSMPVRARRGVSAWLHADAQLELCTRQPPEPLTKTQLARIARRFGVWACEPPRPAADVPADLADLLADFDVDAADLDEDVLAQMRR